MVRSIIYGLVFFVSWAGPIIWIIHKWMGYPLFPGLTTNDFWTLVGMNTEILIWILALTIPMLFVAAIVTTFVLIAEFSVRLGTVLLRSKL